MVLNPCSGTPVLFESYSLIIYSHLSCIVLVLVVAAEELSKSLLGLMITPSLHLSLILDG